MSDGISDMMREQERINNEIFERFIFEESPIDSHMYMEIKKGVFICWDYNYEYWYIEYPRGELKIYPKNINDIIILIDIYTRS